MTTKPVKLEDFFDTCPVCEYRLDDDDDVCPACGEGLFDPEDLLEDMDGDFDSAMASAGFGTDEDYGYYGNDDW